MKGLLDTHALIWWDSRPGLLSKQAFAFIQDPQNTVLLSVASVWEMVIKHMAGKLALRAPIATIVADQVQDGMQVLPVALDHTLALQNLPPVHRDPFDRVLAAQAITENAALISADPVFAHYPVQVIW